MTFPQRRVNVTITDVYAVPDDYGFLRINVGPETAVIDQNASNITVTDVDPAPVPRPEPACICGSVDDFHLPACYEPAPYDKSKKK